MANFKFVKSATALVLGASVLTTAVVVPGADASAKTSYKVTSKGTLVNAKTNKTVKGYVTYKGKLYKDGKVFTGLKDKKYYYKNGVKATGTYKGAYYYKGAKKVTTGTYNGKYYVKGALYTGKTSKNVYYVKGVKFTGVTSYGYTYKDGKRVEGEYKGKVYTNGKLVTGVYKDKLYKAGVLEKGLDLYKEKLYKDGVLNIGLVLFQDKLYKDAGLANGLVTFNNVEDLYKDGVVVPTKVESVSAVNSTTIKVTGTNLSKLTKADLTVSNNTIKSVDASADRTTLTIVVDKQLVDGENVTLTAKEEKFEFSYKLDFKTVSVTDATYDDDTAKQFVKLTIDGKAMTAADLIAAGYDVTFAAYADSKGTTSAAIFADPKTGELNSNLKAYATTTDGKKAYVTVTATKGSQVITSELSPVLIKNTELAADSISAVELTNTKTSPFIQNSKTLVVADTAKISAITVKAGSKEEEVKTNYTVKSSNSAVVNVDASGNLEAKTPGTATITVSYGSTTTTLTLTVKNEARELSKVTVVNGSGDAVSSKTLANDGTTAIGSTVYALAVDQYGDPVLGSTTFTASSVGDILTTPAATGTTLAAASDAKLAAKGYYAVPLTPAKAGNTYLTFTDGGFKVASNTFKVSVSANATVSKYVLENAFTADSDDLTLNNQDLDDDSVSLALNAYTSEGTKVGATALANATDVTVVQGSNLITATWNATDKTVDIATVTGSTKTGTATVKVVYNGVTYQQTITVTSNAPTVTGVTFKGLVSPTYASKFNHTNALTLSGSTTNPVVSGLTLSTSTAQPVRLNVATGELYIDKNADGSYVALDGDTLVGSVAIEYIKATGSNGATASDVITTNLDAGFSFVAGDQGTLVYKVYAANGTSIVSSTSVQINL